MKKYRKTEKRAIAQMIEEELVRALRMAMCDLDPKSPTMNSKDWNFIADCQSPCLSERVCADDFQTGNSKQTNFRPFHRLTSSKQKAETKPKSFVSAPMHQKNKQKDLTFYKFREEYAQALIGICVSAMMNSKSKSLQWHENLHRACLRFQLGSSQLIDLDSLEEDCANLSFVDCNTLFDKQLASISDRF